MGKTVKLLKDVTSQGVTVSAGAFGTIDDSGLAYDGSQTGLGQEINKPGQETGSIKVKFTVPSTIVIPFAIDKMGQYFADWSYLPTT
jgi:hypothetical protein